MRRYTLNLMTAFGMAFIASSTLSLMASHSPFLFLGLAGSAAALWVYRDRDVRMVTKLETAAATACAVSLALYLVVVLADVAWPLESSPVEGTAVNIGVLGLAYGSNIAYSLARLVALVPIQNELPIANIRRPMS